MNPFVTNNAICSIPIYQNVLNVVECKDVEKYVNTEISLTRKESSCPNTRFFDINSHRTRYKDNIENYLVQGQKVVNFEQTNETNFVKKFKYIKSF